MTKIKLDKNYYQHWKEENSIQQFRIYDPSAKKFYYSGGTPTMLRNFFEQTAILNTYYNMPYDKQTPIMSKNKEMIYERDIIETKNYPFYTEEGRNYVGVVEWCEQDCCWVFDMIVVSDRVCGCAVGGMLSELKNITKTGNVYKNSKLINNNF